MLDREFWVGTGKPPLGREREGGGGGLERTRIREIPSTATSTQIPNHKTAKKENDISKQDGEQAKTGKIERNYKMFANPVFINPDRYKFG